MSDSRVSTAAQMHDCQVFGLRVNSAVRIDEFLSWHGDDRLPDITIEIGSVPQIVEDEVHRGPFLAVGRSGVCHLTIPEVARFRIEGGRSILIEPELSLDSPDIRTFLFGSALGILCHQRGLLPLHASAVQIGDKAVAFAGISGAGKSSLAAMLASRGHRLLTDDVAAIDPEAESGPSLMPSFARMKLWRDSLERLGAMDASLPRIRGKIDKFLLAPEKFDPTPVKLSAIYGITPLRGLTSANIVPISGHLAVAMLVNNVYRANVAQIIDGKSRLFGGIVRLAEGAQTWILQRPVDMANLDMLAQQVEEHVRML